jgi:hypothetical protein
VIDAAPGLISIQRGVAVVNYGKNSLAEISAIRRCPTGAIQWIDGAQFTDKTAPSAEPALTGSTFA